MIIIKNENNIKLKNIIHTKLRKNNMEKCKWLKDNVSEHLTGIRMETWDFQAKGFYEKNGYSVFAEIKDCPPGTIDYYLKKELY